MSGPGSGIEVLPEVTDTYDDMQRHKKCYRCIVLKVSDCKSKVVVEKTFDKGSSDEEDYNNIISELGKEPRFLLFDLKAPPAKEGAQENDKIIFLCWIPDTANVHLRMVYASTKKTVRDKLQGVAKDIQANDQNDLKFEDIRAQMKGL